MLARHSTEDICFGCPYSEDQLRMRSRTIFRQLEVQHGGTWTAGLSGSRRTDIGIQRGHAQVRGANKMSADSGTCGYPRGSENLGVALRYDIGRIVGGEIAAAYIS